jgi:XTP/dITP diphosphohydrolase
MVVIATHNPHKAAEIQLLPGSEGLEVCALSYFGDPEEVVENGTTFEENAAIKAVRYSLWLKRELGLEPPVVAEDSGLSIEALLGRPGVESARIAPTDHERIAWVLAEMEGVSLRAAHFTAVTALAVNGQLLHVWRGIVHGRITSEPRGISGFGYDPVFEDQEIGKTFAEMSAEEKNQRSHRARAWMQAFDFLRAHDELSVNSMPSGSLESRE